MQELVQGIEVENDCHGMATGAVCCVPLSAVVALLLCGHTTFRDCQALLHNDAVLLRRTITIHNDAVALLHHTSIGSNVKSALCCSASGPGRHQPNQQA